MSRYIDADKLKEKIEEIEWWNDSTGFYDHIDIVHAYDIDDVPTADVVEVRHGEWLHAGMFDDMAKCSVCGLIDHSLNEVYSRGTYNYCPNCGAKMDGERRSENEG